VPLRRIEIEGFRGIRRMTLELNGTTALIGENSCGKTSVLDALELALAHRATLPCFGPLDFHVPSGMGALPVERISLRFTFLEDAGREVVAEISATRTADGSPAPALPRLVDREGREIHPGDPSAFEAFRRRHPVLRVRFGRPARPAPADRAGPAGTPPSFAGSDAGGRDDTGSPAEGEVTRKLRRTVETAYRKFSGSWRPHPDELREPTEAARALAERWSERLQLPARAPGRAAETLAETPVSLGATDPLRAEAREGTGMQSLALLMLLGAVLEAENGSPVDTGAESLVLIEEAEAHLHPILAARIFRLIDRVPGQKVLTTNSGDLLASVPLHAIRRLVRNAAGVSVHGLGDDALSVDEMRRVGYHIRVNRASSVFARCWLLVEGETESWLLPEVARLLGYDFPAEGIRCVEFAQCGIAPLVKMARGLGIEWHLLADGDDAGRHYVRAARSFLAGEPDRERVTGFRERDVEHHLWGSGYAAVYRAAAAKAGVLPSLFGRRRIPPGAVIDRALKAHGKPRMALEVAEAMSAPGSPGVPRLLASVVEKAVRLARFGN
jgi:putative ATP-dependent endonuclease of OLD family